MPKHIASVLQWLILRETPKALGNVWRKKHQAMVPQNGQAYLRVWKARRMPRCQNKALKPCGHVALRHYKDVHGLTSLFIRSYGFSLPCNASTLVSVVCPLRWFVPAVNDGELAPGPQGTLHL